MENENVEEAKTAETEENSSEETASVNENEKIGDSEGPSGPKAVEDFKEKFYYLAAEFENTKKRLEREKQNIVKFGQEKMIKQLLDVVDNLERTLDAVGEETDKKILNIKEGVSMVSGSFLKVLEENGLEHVDALGKEFDPNFHEALAQQACEGKPDNEVIQVFQKGYTLNGRLIRPAKVVVAKN